MRGFVSILGVLLVLLVVSPLAFSQDSAGVRLINLSPDTKQVDLWVDGALTREFLQYSVASDYINLSGGTHQIQVHAARGESVLAQLQVEVSVAAKYTIGLTGLSAQNNLKLFSLADDQSSSFVYAKVRFVNATPGMPAVDIAIADSRTVLVSNLGYQQSSPYVQVQPGVYDLEVRAAGTTNVLYTIPKAGLSRAANCTIYMTNVGTNETLETTHTFEANSHLENNQIVIGLILWAALLAWFVQNHAKS
ncbi:DUF4397 domain-containing protein [Candidatus Acetothermia bacterium]|nr:DUF4397 domain-containing protein [Candidatus Acetothermia bacterium]MBI3644086.1 DUF4397 domain-containing protein [Candidatus Acetothermia bacterium]